MIALAILAQDVGAAARASVAPAGFLERLATPLAGFIAILAVAVAARALLRRRVDWRGVAVVIAVLALNWLLLVSGKVVQLEIDGLRWNWPGKLAAIAATFLLIWRWPGIAWRDVGLTWRQTPGSTRPMLAVLAAYCAAVWGIEYAIDGAAGLALPPAETLAFQATMPSLDEEPLFRGLALLLLMRALGSPGPGLWFGPAAVALSLAFGLNHAVSLSDGLHFNAAAFALTGSFGLAATWMRLRSGSLIFPLILHSTTNLGLAFL